MVTNLFSSLHLAIEGKGSDAVGAEAFGNFTCATCSRHIDNSGTAMAENEVAQLLVFIVIGIGMDDAIAQVFPFGIGGEYLEC